MRIVTGTFLTRVGGVPAAVPKYPVISEIHYICLCDERHEWELWRWGYHSCGQNYLRREIFCRKLFDPLSGGRSGSVCLVIITLLSKYENIITRISITTLVWTNHDYGDDYEFRIYLTVYIWRCKTDQMTQETVIWIPVLRRVSHPSR